jgi:hypothetical protein
MASITLWITPSKSKELTTDLSGNWTVRWLSNDTYNPMFLTQAKEILSGTYTNDKKDYCSVSGKFNPNSNTITLQIVCQEWKIRMEGFSSLDRKLIVGSYLAYGNSVGGFMMNRE